LLHRLGIGRLTEPAILAIHVGPDLCQRFALAHQSHRVTRDVYTDASLISMITKDNGPIWLEFLDETIQVTLMSHASAAAVAGKLGQNIRVGNGKPIGLLHHRRGPLYPFGKLGNRGQFDFGPCRVSIPSSGEDKAPAFSITILLL